MQAVSRSLAATREISVDFFSSGYLDVSVLRVRFLTPMYSVQDDQLTLAGLPHSGISGSKSVIDSPKLFADYYALHRLLSPRHSPCALIHLTI